MFTFGDAVSIPPDPPNRQEMISDQAKAKDHIWTVYMLFNMDRENIGGHFKQSVLVATEAAKLS